MKGAFFVARVCRKRHVEAGVEAVSGNLVIEVGDRSGLGVRGAVYRRPPDSRQLVFHDDGTRIVLRERGIDAIRGFERSRSIRTAAIEKGGSDRLEGWYFLADGAIDQRELRSRRTAQRFGLRMDFLNGGKEIQQIGRGPEPGLSQMFRLIALVSRRIQKRLPGSCLRDVGPKLDVRRAQLRQAHSSSFRERDDGELFPLLRGEDVELLSDLRPEQRQLHAALLFVAKHEVVDLADDDEIRGSEGVGVRIFEPGFVAILADILDRFDDRALVREDAGCLRNLYFQRRQRNERQRSIRRGRSARAGRGEQPDHQNCEQSI
jgi:hypothetical protein